MNLALRTALTVAAVSTVMLGLIGIGGYVLVRDRVIEAEQAKIEVRARAAASRVEARLQQAAQAAEGLSSNLVIRNALLDSTGRETYVQPILASLAQIDGQPVSLSLVDFQGASVIAAGADPAATTTADARAWLRSRIDGAGPGARVFQRDGAPGLVLIAAPMLMPNTKSFEGAMAVGVPASALMAGLGTPGERYSLVAAGSGTADTNAVRDIALRPAAPLDALGLAVRVQADRGGLDLALRDLQLQYLALGLAGIAAMVVLSIVAARRLALPIRSLAEAAQRVSAQSPQDARIEVPASATGEVAVLAQSLAGMLARLGAAAESERHGLETQFRALFDHSPIGMTLAGTDGSGMRSNPAFAQMIGYSPGELRRLDFLSITHPDDRPRNRELLEATVAGQLQSYRYEKRMQRKSGEYIWVAVVTSPLRDRQGRVTGVVSQVEDITERRAAAVALAEAHARIDAVLSAVPDLWFVLDAEGRFIDVSDPAHAALAVPWESMRGHRLDEVMQQPIARLAADAMRRARQDNQFQLIEYRIDAAGEGGRHFEARLAPMRRGRWLYLARDITERKRAEEQTRSALREKEVLLKEIYHRVKNNLQVIASLLSLQGRDERAAGARGPLEDSANRVKSMALVHEQLYRGGDLSSIDFAAYLAQLVGHVGEAHGDSARRVPVVLDVEPLKLGIETAVPLGLIVNELLTNAYKHAYPDGRGGEVLLRMRTLDDGRVELVVADHGVGIPEGVRPGDGATLGMRLVVSLTQQLEGSFDSAPNPGGGARFTLRFMPDAPEPRRMAA